MFYFERYDAWGEEGERLIREKVDVFMAIDVLLQTAKQIRDGNDELSASFWYAKRLAEVGNMPVWRGSTTCTSAGHPWPPAGHGAGR